MSTNHTWKFFRAGGFDQVRLESGADIANLRQLDQKLWVALACPTRGIEFDTKTLDAIDADKDGRIRAPEIIAASEWATKVLKNPDDLTRSSASLSLSSINDGTPEGKAILASAKQVLANLGKKDSATISVDDFADPPRFSHRPPRRETATASSRPTRPPMTPPRPSSTTSSRASARRTTAVASPASGRPRSINSSRTRRLFPIGTKSRKPTRPISSRSATRLRALRQPSRR
jgi:hypothetical protein